MCLEYKNSNNIYRSGTGMMVGSCLKQLNLPFIYSVSWPRSVIDLSSQNEYNITTFMCTFTVNRKEGEGGGATEEKSYQCTRLQCCEDWHQRLPAPSRQTGR